MAPSALRARDLEVLAEFKSGATAREVAQRLAVSMAFVYAAMARVADLITVMPVTVVLHDPQADDQEYELVERLADGSLRIAPTRPSPGTSQAAIAERVGGEPLSMSEFAEHFGDLPVARR